MDHRLRSASFLPPAGPPALRRLGALLICLCVAALLAVSAGRVGLGDAAGRVGAQILKGAGLASPSAEAEGAPSVLSQMFPPALARRTPLDRLDGVDPAHLPFGARIEMAVSLEPTLNPETLELETVEVETPELVEPLGYLFYVLWKMVETIEIALWASLLAVLASAPLAIAAARNYTPHGGLYVAARGLVAFMRAMPELITALFMVLAFGFGPVAGILALAIHSAGFLAKFYAEDIENADRRPQEALEASGAGRLKTLRLAVLPNVLPNYTALTLYVLDRNVRMATVVGLVGGGGIGQELKGRFDMFQYDHIATILIVIFAVVIALDQVAARIRKRIL